MSRRIVRRMMRCSTVLGSVYEVVQYDDGGWGVARDGVPIEGQEWACGDLAGCLRAHERFCMMDGGGGPPPSSSGQAGASPDPQP
jgi:hypothetical protein